MDVEKTLSPAELSVGKRARFWNCLRGIRLCLVLGVFVVHFGLREYQNRVRPLADHHNYEVAYDYMLSLMEGRGFNSFVLGDDPTSVPVAEFLSLKREKLSSVELHAYLEAHPPVALEASSRGWELLSYTRILDCYLTAGLWKVFGMNWYVLYTFYAVVSTGACGLIFLIARRLSGQYWAGWTAALLFCLSPLESHLATWTIRDTSPLWFTALGFWFLISVVFRCRSRRTLWISSLAMGIVAMVGIGWRTDALFLAPVLGMGSFVQQIVQRRSWSGIVVSCLLFVVGAWGCRAAVFSLVPSRVSPSVGTAFHLACYADIARCNVLEIENSFQTHRCDIQTLFTARQCESKTGEPASLIYLGPEYNGACQKMYLEQARYNAFSWVAYFPRYYVQALGGLIVPEAFATTNVYSQVEYRPAWLRVPFRILVHPLIRLMPLWFFVGVLVYVLTRPNRTGGLLLAGFSVFYAAILFLILPEQKHVGALLVPLHVFGGMGAWTIGSLFWKTSRQLLLVKIPRLRVRQLASGAGMIVAVWGSLSGAAYVVSRQTRTEILNDIQHLAAQGDNASDLLRGSKVFHLSLIPNDPGDRTGYLLTINAGEKPGEVLCQHEHLPQDWGWSRGLQTHHPLVAKKTQYFFVTCLQGGCHGDPRPYSCHVLVDGDAEIENCTRVDCAKWNHLQVSTLFHAGQTSAGSPSTHKTYSEFGDAGLFAFDNHAAQVGFQIWAKAMYQSPPYMLPTITKPLSQLIGREPETGVWKIANSVGDKFETRNLNWWAPEKNFDCVRTGDFNGDGMVDILCHSSEHQKWYRLDSDRGMWPYRECSDWTNGRKLCDIVVGDFNGDGLDDIAGRDKKTGEWVVGLSNGRGFVVQTGGQWSPETDWKFVVTGKFSGTKQTEIAGYNPSTGTWTIMTLDGMRFVNRESGTWNHSIPWKHLVVADFNGDGRDDIAAFDPVTGDWHVALSTGNGLESKVWCRWSNKIAWQNVKTGDFNGDGKADLVARDPENNEVVVAQSDGNQLNLQTPQSLPFGVKDLLVGEFDGDGCDDISVRNETTGEIWVGISTRKSTEFSFDFRKWKEGDHDAALQDVQVAELWPRSKTKAPFRIAKPSTSAEAH